MIPFTSSFFGILEFTYHLMLAASASLLVIALLCFFQWWRGASIVSMVLLGTSIVIFSGTSVLLVWIWYSERTRPTFLEYAANVSLNFEQDLQLLVSQVVETEVYEVKKGLWGDLSNPVRIEKIPERKALQFRDFYKDPVFFGGTFAKHSKVGLSLTIGELVANFSGIETITINPTQEGRVSAVGFLTVSSRSIEDLMLQSKTICDQLSHLGWTSCGSESSSLISKGNSDQLQSREFGVYLLKPTAIGDFSAYVYLRNWESKSIRASIQVEIETVKSGTNR